VTPRPGWPPCAGLNVQGLPCGLPSRVTFAPLSPPVPAPRPPRVPELSTSRSYCARHVTQGVDRVLRVLPPGERVTFAGYRDAPAPPPPTETDPA